MRKRKVVWCGKVKAGDEKDKETKTKTKRLENKSVENVKVNVQH